MAALTPDIAALNARRRRAVELRVDGRSLAEIREATGLSVPTIISAYRAFQAGGWSAIPVGARGRPRGDGRVLPAEQEQALRQAALSDGPEQHGLGEPLWTVAALGELARRHFGAKLSARALSRLLERWGLALVALRTPRADADAGWLRQVWSPAVRQARSDSAALAWAGALAHPDRPAPGGLLVALRPQGSLAWWPVRGTLATADTYIEFLARLLHSEPGPWRVFLHGPDFRRVPQVQRWLASQPRLTLQPCPLAPRPRRAAEPAEPGPALAQLQPSTPTSFTFSPSSSATPAPTTAIIAPPEACPARDDRLHLSFTA